VGSRERDRFEVLLKPELRVLHATARRLSASREDAADLVQETCLRAFRTFDHFTAGTNARAWLLTILWSVHANRRRSDRKGRVVSIEELEARLPGGFEPVDPEADQALFRNADPKGWGDEVDAALRELSEDFRAPVLLVDVAELSYEATAEILGCPMGTVRSRLYRARSVLASRLADYARKRMRGGRS
jgi:RNA polymerase sigma-70 factor (ECF subfamily)